MSSKNASARRKLEALADGLSVEYAVDKNLVRAVIKVESSWQPVCTRFEAHYRWTYFPRDWAHKLNIPYEAELFFQKSSWGIMQVMGALARELGHKNHIVDLCEPEIGARFGVMYLAKLQKRYEVESDVIAAYNAGSPRKTSGGMYQNQRYVDKVHQELNLLRRLV